MYVFIMELDNFRVIIIISITIGEIRSPCLTMTPPALEM